MYRCLRHAILSERLFQILLKSFIHFKMLLIILYVWLLVLFPSHCPLLIATVNDPCMQKSDVLGHWAQINMWSNAFPYCGLPPAGNLVGPLFYYERDPVEFKIVRNKLITQAIMTDRLKQKSPDKDDDDDDIPVIPELEEQQEDDLTSTIAAAPNVIVNRVATYRELDSDLLRQAAFLTLDNEIDLKLLTKALSLPEDIIEDDKSWDWNRLFTEISSELRTELEMTDDLDEEKTVLVGQ